MGALIAGYCMENGLYMDKSGSKAASWEGTAVVQVRSGDGLGEVMAMGMDRSVRINRT